MMNNVLKAYEKKIMLLSMDLVFVMVTLPLSLIIRLDLRPAVEWLEGLYPHYYLLAVFSYFISFFAFRTYRTILRLASLSTAIRVGVSVLVGGVTFFFLSTQVLKFSPVPRSLFLIQMLLLAPACLMLRFSIRIFERLTRQEGVGPNTLIYGGGLTTDRLLPMLLKTESKFRIVGIIDDDPAKKGCDIQGIKIRGSSELIPQLVEKYDVEQIFLSMPGVEGQKIKEIINRYSKLELKFKILPSPEEYFLENPLNSEIDIRDVNICDLLRRPPRNIDKEAIERLIGDQTVLVTGGGGSIGSELVRQIAQMKPRSLIINDSSEFALYSIYEEMSTRFPYLEIIPHLGNIADALVCKKLFSKYGIDIVFHACAYKHVPIVEFNVANAIRNNLLSALNVFQNASQQKQTRVVLISSDKAVRPTNVMGASKRICELLALRFSEKFSTTSFTCVRFGNVLGSSGSVIPKFMAQIKSGGPITVTHPEMKRYFMLIPEAASLVLQASTSSHSGEIFILNMGEPVKIADVASDLIRLMGKRPGEDVEIHYTGLRPGEKMYEELHLENEHVEHLSEDFFKVTLKFDLGTSFDDKLSHLISVTELGDENAIKKCIFDFVKAYEPEDKQTKVNKNSEQVEFREEHSLGGKIRSPGFGNKPLIDEATAQICVQALG